MFDKFSILGTTVFAPLIVGSLQLFAQSPEVISGGAGWVGAGLLGAVLSWLTLVHLPAKDKQVKELIDLHALERDKDRTETSSLRQAFAEEQEQTRINNAAERQSQREEYTQKMTEMQALLIQTIKEFRTAVHDTKDTANTAVMRTELAAQRAIESSKSQAGG